MKITELTQTSCPRTKAKQCWCESVNALTEANETVYAVVSELIHTDKVKGQILFMQRPGEPTLIKGRITGLEPGKHGFHIHEVGELSNGCDSAGPHYDPDGVDHGDVDKGHVGDLGNITANPSGVADFTIVAKRVDLSGDRSVVGRAIVIHSDEDDLGKGGDEESLKTGNAGERVACGVITLKDKSGE
jgi:Cu-Zn family superoxide dismutase